MVLCTMFMLIAVSCLQSFNCCPLQKRLFFTSVVPAGLSHRETHWSLGSRWQVRAGLGQGSHRTCRMYCSCCRAMTWGVGRGARQLSFHPGTQPGTIGYQLINLDLYGPYEVIQLIYSLLIDYVNRDNNFAKEHNPPACSKGTLVAVS